MREHLEKYIDPTSDTAAVVIAVNRGPVTGKLEDGKVTLKLAPPGGVNTALSQLVGRDGTMHCWIDVYADDDCTPDLLTTALAEQAPHVRPALIERETFDKYYRMLANEGLWPLMHGFYNQSSFSLDAWRAYLESNDTFARNIVGDYKPGSIILGQDYHLAPLGLLIREQLKEQAIFNPTIGHYHHIPFPDLTRQPDALIPKNIRRMLARSYASYDLVGLQRMQDVRNMAKFISENLEGVIIEDGEQGVIIDTPTAPHITYLRNIPIGTDVEDFENRASLPEVRNLAEQLKAQSRGRLRFFTVSRRDYTKGIIEQLQAFDIFLDEHPELKDKVLLDLILAPTREKVQGYAEYAQEVMRLVQNINSKHSVNGVKPVEYYKNGEDGIDQNGVVAHNLAADYNIVNSIADGQNLTAHEAAALKTALILSNGAGAADVFRDSALLVNPHNIQEIAQTMFQATTISNRQRRRMTDLAYQRARENDIHAWNRTQVQILNAIQRRKALAI